MEESVKPFDARLIHPFCAIVAGPSSAGKTSWIANLLKHEEQLISVRYDYIIVFVGIETPIIKELELHLEGRLRIIKGIPDHVETLINAEKNGLFIFDDLMGSITKQAQISQIFTCFSHHCNLSCIIILQNLFCDGKERTTFMRNSQYLVLFNNPLDQTVPFILSHRIKPSRKSTVVKMMFHVMSTYRYILIDGKQDTPESARFRSDLFSGLYQRCFVIDNP